MTQKIAVLPGDGIGTEIVAEAVKVLNALDLPLETGDRAGGRSRRRKPPATRCPKPTLKLAQEADAILFGAVGDWK